MLGKNKKSDFVEIVSDQRIDVAMQYPALGMTHAEKSCLMRREVAEMLYHAAKRLPAGYRFRIWDAWRPFALQQELYETYSMNIIRDFGLDQVSESERDAVIRGFVSEPVEDRETPPVHTTGGAVDLTILDASGKELDMGTAFDAFTEKTKTNFFEQADKEPLRTIRENRRLLCRVMLKEGFTNLPSEWWHFDYGDRFWADFKGKTAIYGGVFTKEEIGGYGQFHK